MLAQALATDRIAVNSMCPGWVRMDKGGPNATRSVEEGADTAVWLAAEAPHDLTGKSSATDRESRGGIWASSRMVFGYSFEDQIP